MVMCETNGSVDFVGIWRKKKEEGKTVYFVFRVEGKDKQMQAKKMKIYFHLRFPLFLLSFYVFVVLTFVIFLTLSLWNQIAGSYFLPTSFLFLYKTKQSNITSFSRNFSPTYFVFP